MIRFTHKQLFQFGAAIGLFALLIAVNVYVISHPQLIEALTSVGLIGLFFLSILSGFNVLVPIPIAALYPTFAALGYAPALIIGIIAAGMTVGDMIGYILGASSRNFFADSALYRRVAQLTQEHPKFLVLGIFIYGMIVPLPNELIVLPLAALRVPWYKVLIPLLLGNSIFTSILAFGASGITQLFL